MRNFQEQREVIINMIEKKIKYDINIEKPSKTKPVTQGGVLNYLGKQKTVTAPRRWRSSADHPIAHLAYITKDEEKILIDLNLYGSLKGKPNKGPSGIMSLQGSGGGAGGGDGGDGGSSGGDGGQGDSGPGGSDDGTGHGGPGPGSPEGSSLGDANDQGGTAAPGGPAGGPAGGPGGSEGFDTMSGPTGFGFGEQDETGFGTDYSDATMGPVGANAMGVTEDKGIMSTLTGLAQKAIETYMTYSPTVNAVKGLVGLVEAVANPRGVTAPDDYSQLETSVQFGPPPSATESSGDGGIKTLVPDRYELYNNITTGDPVMDALIARYRIDPSAFGIR